MPSLDNVAAANKINDLLKVVLSQGGFRLKYRITVNQPSASPEEDLWRSPDILVDMAGPDSGLLLERGAELLNSFEHLALKALMTGELTPAEAIANRAVRITGRPALLNRFVDIFHIPAPP